MSAKKVPVFLREGANNRIVEAELCHDITEDDLLQWETDWASAQAEAIKALTIAKIPRKHWDESLHWNWRNKFNVTQGLLSHPKLSLRVDGKVQGMMHLTLTEAARHETQIGKPLVYIDFIQNAPWNRPSLTQGPPRFRGIGSIFIGAAINMSLDEEMRGRVGLHSLPQSESFYRDKCGMSDIGIDPTHQGLRYFEFTSNQAEQFSKTGGKR